jgi:putative molybdopterin biosynthesis protein
MVGCDPANAAVGLRAFESAFGLDFIAMEVVRCDLVILREFMEHRAVQVMLDVLQSLRLRDEPACLPGYEASVTNGIVGLE